MKLGDEVFIHGYVDEIRKDTVIIRNEGGYFGTVKSEIRGTQPCDLNGYSGRLWKKAYEKGRADVMAEYGINPHQE